ncbi:hypothetical protein [Fibrella aquatilis]|uniref:Uncharacterized protein n=1 Tax=Fibrella aquatilis TaxID=2817059 RepID=A0A939GAQ0_9BACT|nr:hypothetical protein [Fibrella aquatilis]MBO0933779.1 hypothetical protein [Fibrella aquatilis]
MPIDRIPFQGILPPSFFDVPSYAPVAESPATVAQLVAMEADRNETILYTDHATFRLVGIFPALSDEAYFGFWETANDLAINQQAFACLEADARQRGRVAVVGPLHFSTFHAYRLRLNEPSWGQFDREPANPSYYPVLLQQLGYQARSRFESRLVRKENIPLAYDQKKQLLDALTHIPFDVIPLNPDTWQHCEGELYELVHHVFSANPAYRPISQAQFELLYNRQFAEKLCPHSSVLFRDRLSGCLVALSFCQPNCQSLLFAPGEVPQFGRDFPRLGRKQLLVKSVGVHPAFRQQGLMSFLGAYGMVHFQELYDDVIFCLMRADNFSLHFSDTLPHETAHYALFEKPFSSISK